MKNLFLNFCFLLLLGQLNAFGVIPCPTDDVNPLILLTPSLTLKANIYYGDEDEETSPIAETDFYLLDKSLINILKDSGFKPETEDGKQHKIEEENYLEAAARAFTSQDDEEAEIIAILIRKAISKHQQSGIQRTN